ncbi:MAG: serine/threonine-protein kinase [Anaerolineae bacterium]
MTIQAGDRLGNYVITSHLSQGGMADIYRASDVRDNSDVVLKVPHISLVGDPALYDRFQREVTIAQRLNHPGVQHAVATLKADGLPYLVLNYVDGVPLRNLIRERAPLPVAEAEDLIRQLADIMAYCHSEDVIHRDLKPDNLLVTPEHKLVLLDFGAALLEGARRITWANLTATLGTPDYMAPEQIQGKRGDERTDIYALGAIYYELLTGEPPFTGDNALAIMNQHLNATPPRADHANKAVSEATAAIIAKCLQKNAAERYQSMTEVLHDLDHPEDVDLSVLAKVAPTRRFGLSDSQYTVIVALLISIVILLGMVLIGIGAQYLHTR